jgi:hypothetical protein
VNSHGALRSVGIASGDRFGDGPMFCVPLSGPLRIDTHAVAQSQTNVGADLPQQGVQGRGKVIARAGGDRLMEDQIGGAGIDVPAGCSRSQDTGDFERGSAQCRQAREARLNCEPHFDDLDGVRGADQTFLAPQSGAAAPRRRGAYLAVGAKHFERAAQLMPLDIQLLRDGSLSRQAASVANRSRKVSTSR